MVGAVPRILYEEKTSSAIVSILLSIVIGTLFIYLLIRFFNRFPGIGFPELVKKHMPKWMSVSLLFCFSLIWFAVGLNGLISNTYLMKRFLTPDIPFFWITVLLLAFVSFGVLMSTKSLLYTVEIILLINLPLLVLVIVQLYLNENIKWEFIGKAWMHLYHQPSYSSFSASFFSFIGLINLAIFNREFKTKQTHTPFQILVVGVLGVGALLTTYFTPIGYNGFDNINHISYPWVLTVDSIRIGLAFLERVMYIFLIFYFSIAFLFIVTTWHVGLEFLKSLGSIQWLKWKGHNLTSYLFLLLFWIISLWTAVHVSHFRITLYASYLFRVIPPFCTIFLFVCLYIYRRAKI